MHGDDFHAFLRKISDEKNRISARSLYVRSFCCEGMQNSLYKASGLDKKLLETPQLDRPLDTHAIGGGDTSGCAAKVRTAASAASDIVAPAASQSRADRPSRFSPETE